MLTKFIVGALLIAGATSANAVTFAAFIPANDLTNIELAGGSLTSSDPVKFSYLIPELLPLGPLDALFTFNATETGAIDLGGVVIATFDGTFSFTYTGPSGIVSGVNLQTGDNLLSGVFADSVFTGFGSSGSLIDSVLGGGDVVFSSWFLEFDPAEDQALALSITSISPPLAVVNGMLTDFTGTAGGNFAATITDIDYHIDVPEPASWAMMVAGFGMLGGAMRRSRRSSGTVVTA